MTTSWSLRITAALLLLYGLNALYMVVKYNSLWFLVWVAPCFAAVGGLLLSRAWSQYLVYLIGSCTVLGWAAFVAIYVSQGLATEYIIRLLGLGAVLIALFGWSSLVVRNHFKTNAKQI